MNRYKIFFWPNGMLKCITQEIEHKYVRIYREYRINGNSWDIFQTLLTKI